MGDGAGEAQQEVPQEVQGKPRGPFAVEPVDPLVYQQGTDSPELRPAALYVPVAPQLRARMPKPSAAMDVTYQRWTPGGLPSVPGQPGRPSRDSSAGAARAVRLLLLLLPAAVIAASIWFAVTQIGT